MGYALLGILLVLPVIYTKKNSGMAGSSQLYTANNKMITTCLVLLIAGGTSNLVDRLARQGVVDIFLIHTSAWNIADLFILLGGTLLLILLILKFNKQNNT